MYCSKCGKELDDSFNCCPYCGTPIKVNNYQTQSTPKSEDSGNALWALLGFFIPLVGLILYLVWKDDKPKDAHQAGKGALISTIVGACLGLVALVFYFILMAVMFF